MSKSITLTPAQWDKLRSRIRNDYAPSVTMVRGKMRDVLGFVDREHREWVSEGIINGYDAGRTITTVHLDFYNEPKRTMFLLKYSEYLDNSGKNALD